MRSLIIRRIIVSVPLIVVVTGLTFVLESLVPGNTARAIVGASGSPAAYQRLRVELGLNNPLWYQYWQYLDQLLHGNLGTSVFTGEPVSTLLNQRLGVTLSLVLLATAFCAVIGAALGVVSAVRGGVVGRAVDVLSLVGLALPGFWVAIILAAVFAVTLRIFPATGYVPPTDSVARWLWALTLPVIALGLAGVASVAKQTRDSMKDTLGQGVRQDAAGQRHRAALHHLEARAAQRRDPRRHRARARLRQRAELNGVRRGGVRAARPRQHGRHGDQPA